MKMKVVAFFVVLLCAFKSNAQIVSQFSWDHGGAVTIADVGPDGISVSASAISDVGGVGGTNGLNAGLPKRDIVLEIPGSPTFDINGIDVSFDYQREESGGNFVQRGSSLIIKGCAQLSVSYRVDDGAGGDLTVNSGNVYNIPFDDTYRTYRFTYMPLTGEGELSVDGVSVWTNDGPDNRNLYWTGAGNLFIGNGMDGTGYDNTFLDNMTIGDIFDSPLPVELLHFDATEKEEQEVICEWSTASERNNDYFNIERSIDGLNWNVIGKVDGAKNSTDLIEYEFIDPNPFYGVSYYRLKQVDLDGHFTHSSPVSILRELGGEMGMLLYPNPTLTTLNVFLNETTDQIFIFDISGRIVQSIRINSSVSSNQPYEIDVSALVPGTYYLRINNLTQAFVKN